MADPDAAAAAAAETAAEESAAAAKPAKVKKTRVVLKCIYSGYPGDPGPGTVIEVDAAEAERLIAAKVATAA